jgi:hypothetical protein
MDEDCLLNNNSKPRSTYPVEILLPLAVAKVDRVNRRNAMWVDVRGQLPERAERH